MEGEKEIGGDLRQEGEKERGGERGRGRRGRGRRGGGRGRLKAGGREKEGDGWRR